MIRLDGPPPGGPFYAISDTAEGIQWLASESTTAAGDAILVAFGPDADRFDLSSPDAVADEVGRLLPGAKVAETFFWDWLHDPWARGTWNMFKPNTLSKYGDALAAPHPEPRPAAAAPDAAPPVHFAGDYLGQGWNGFMDGAIESGIRSARAIAAQLKAADDQGDRP